MQERMLIYAKAHYISHCCNNKNAMHLAMLIRLGYINEPNDT